MTQQSIVPVNHRVWSLTMIFSYQNLGHWQGKTLVDVETVVNLIQSTTTENGLSVVCMLDKNVYETGIKVSNENFDAIDIEYIGPHHGWSYFFCILIWKSWNQRIHLYFVDM
mgnify:CR=1 FL=1